MKFSLPFNWEYDLLAQLNSFPSVHDLYGKLESDFVGGGKHSCQVPSVSKRYLERCVKEIHRANRKFNYLLNSTCLNNLEFAASGQREIMRLLEWLVRIEVDAVTVAQPYLARLIKERFSSLRVSVSVLAGVNSVPKAKFWSDLGADRITLLNTDLNRDFRTIRKIKNAVKCEIQLIANVNCLYRCPFYFYHNSLSSHSSQSWHPTRGFLIDYCRLRCRYRQLLDPLEIIRSPWIRPEDVHYYEEAGVDCLKLIDRGMTTQSIVMIAKAYDQRSYKGNLLDLFPNPKKSLIFKDPNLVHKFRYFFRPFSVNIFKLIKMQELFNEIYYVDNSRLDGFINYFLNGKDCALLDCKECGYCKRISEDIVKFDPKQQLKITGKYKQCLDSIINGEMFCYLSRAPAVV